jgi:hypothetical protein
VGGGKCGGGAEYRRCVRPSEPSRRCGQPYRLVETSFSRVLPAPPRGCARSFGSTLPPV